MYTIEGFDKTGTFEIRVVYPSQISDDFETVTIATNLSFDRAINVSQGWIETYYSDKEYEQFVRYEDIGYCEKNAPSGVRLWLRIQPDRLTRIHRNMKKSEEALHQAILTNKREIEYYELALKQSKRRG